MKLVKYPNEILKKVCEKVVEFNKELSDNLDQMREIMKANKGIGLAANQVGISQRFFIVQDKYGQIFDFINPEIIEREGHMQINEGCLSAPGVLVQVPRSQTITIKAHRRDGEEFTMVAYDVEAICIQHELDHLDGIFYLEKVNRQQRRAALKTLGLKDLI